MTSRSEQQPPVAGAQVSTNPEVSSDASDASVLSKQSTKNPVTILYMIFNLSLDAHIYIPRGTIVAHPNGNECEVDVIEVAETIEEAQGTMQYRNHLQNRPQLPMPLKSDLICSPAEAKYHRRVELKDHNASADMKSQFEELCSQFPEVFSTNNEDTSHTNLITMVLTLVTVHHLLKSHTCCCSSNMTGYSKKSKVWKRQVSLPEVFPRGPVLSLGS